MKSDETKEMLESITKSQENLHVKIDSILSQTEHLPKVLDGGQVQRLLTISERTLAEWRANGSIPYVKIGGIIRYRVKDLQGILQPIIEKTDDHLDGILLMKKFTPK